MPTQIFVNLPVTDLDRTKAFFAELGFTFNAQFTDANAACMIIAENIYAMLLTRPFFQGFTSKAIADTATTVEVLNALSMDSKAEVDVMMGKALRAGGKEPRPAQDHGFMYQRGFEDPDGHTWEIFWMDPNHVHTPS